MTPEEIAARDREWLAKHYRGDSTPQLTVRAIVLGMLLGGVMSLSNLYVGLKIGWGLGVAITSSILAFAIMTLLRKLLPRVIRSDFSILENNTMASCASAAGYMSSAGLVSAIPALDMMIRDDRASGHPDPALQALAMSDWAIVGWLSAISILGVVMAVPLKRQLINVEQLKFPSGVAAAETLRSMYSRGEEAMRKARALMYTALAGAVFKFLMEAERRRPEDITLTGVPGRIARTIGGLLQWKTWKAPEILSLPVTLKGYPLASYSLGIPASSLMFAAGAIIGIKIGVSLFLGAVINYGLLLPWLVDQGVFERVVANDPALTRAAIEARHHVPVVSTAALAAYMRGKWSVWPGTALMVTAGLLSFAFRWRLVLRALSGAIDRLKNKRTATGDNDPLAHIEVPGSWFVTGFVLSGAATVLLQSTLFGIRWWMGILAVLLTFVLSLVAARATGETDITPIGALGKITQLLFGALAPAQPAVNLMTANVTAGASSHSADLLTDVKTGYLLGANPRKQFIAQMFGVVAGAVACVPVYRLIASPDKLGVTMPAPAAMTWRSVAELLSHGFGALPMYAREAMVVGAVLGVVIACLEEFVPKSKKWLPSPTGLGIACVVDAKDSVAMFLGAVAAWWLARVRPDWDERYTVAASSGFIAGESLMGVAIAALAVGQVLAE